MTGYAPLAVFIATIAAASLHAQASRSFDELRRSVPQAVADTTLQVRLRWQTAEPTANAARTANTFRLLSARQVAGSLRRDRSPQVSTTSLVAVSLSEDGRELDWRTLSDPRVVRAERPTETADLTGERLYYLDIEILLEVPDLPDTARLRLYSVRAESGRAMLDPLGTISLR